MVLARTLYMIELFRTRITEREFSMLPDFNVVLAAIDDRMIDGHIVLTEFKDGRAKFEVCVRTRKPIPHYDTVDLSEKVTKVTRGAVSELADILYSMIREEDMAIECWVGWYSENENN